MKVTIILLVLVLVAVSAYLTYQYTLYRKGKKALLMEMTQKDLERYSKAVSDNGVVSALLKRNQPLYTTVNYNNLPLATEIEVREAVSTKKVYSFKCHTPMSQIIIADAIQKMATAINEMVDYEGK